LAQAERTLSLQGWADMTGANLAMALTAMTRLTNIFADLFRVMWVPKTHHALE